jgi:opacity protein-like surface antigen
VQSGTMEFHFLGSANFGYNIGRTWHAAASYRRGWEILNGSLQPFLNDAVTAGVSGGLGRRGAAGMTASFLLGEQQSTTANNHAYAVGSFVNFQLRRNLSGFAQYAYYHQQFDLTLTGLNLPFKVSRNTARAGLTLSLRSR